AWNTLAGATGRPPRSGPGETRPQPVPIGQVASGDLAAHPTGLGEVDRVLGGGLVPGSVTLLAGEPGVGKSTLLLQLMGQLTRNGRSCLLVAAEEAPHQVRLRAERLETLSADLLLVAETDLGAVVEHVARLRPDYLVVDSIQAVVAPDVDAAAGSVAQVRASAQRLVRQAKEQGVTTVLVGHVTKEGGLAGPRVLEHLVDTVLSFGGERHHALRLLRAVKHRFGSTAELGLFEMTEGGLEAVADAGHLFLSDRRPGVPGSAVAVVLDGRRPLLIELQALVAPSGAGRHTVQGLEAGRLHLLLAVLDRRAGLRTAGSDVYALAAGGARVRDPGADLALALAVASTATGVPLPPDLVACGEVGLGGELRQVPQLQRRLAEAARLGFHQAVVPDSSPSLPAGIRTRRARTLAEALTVAGLDQRPRAMARAP
ncbi:MAG: DNA repair protein RadA, partial [Acidimicrobiales bacterium]